VDRTRSGGQCFAICEHDAVQWLSGDVDGPYRFEMIQRFERFVALKQQRQDDKQKDPDGKKDEDSNEAFFS
jgi:hypothetical protein